MSIIKSWFDWNETAALQHTWRAIIALADVWRTNKRMLIDLFAFPTIYSLVDASTMPFWEWLSRDMYESVSKPAQHWI